MVGPITLVGSGVDGLRGLPCGIARHGAASTQRMVRPFDAREFRRVGGSDVTSMYPAFDLSVLLRAITGFSARAISLRKRSGAVCFIGCRTPGGKQSENQLE